MKDEYKPSKKEMIKEIFNGFKDTSDLIGATSFFKSFFISYGRGYVDSFTIPTTVRKALDYKRSKGEFAFRKRPLVSRLGKSFGRTFGISEQAIFCLLAYEGLFYRAGYLAAAPQAISLGYEIYRTYENAKKRVIEKHSNKSIESKIEE